MGTSRRSFVPGHRCPHGRTFRPVGAEYVGKDGYVMVKVRERPDVPCSKDNWMLKHKHVWEQAHGCKVPKGWVVMFMDRDMRNFDPANLDCLPRGTLQVMNSMVSRDPRLAWHDAETFHAVRLMAETKRAICDARRRMRHGKKAEADSVNGRAIPRR